MNMYILINVILWLLLLDTIVRFFIKPKIDRLSCGIFAWAGISVKSFNQDKFDKLGIQNETRGKDSCGITVDGEIYTGIDDTKLYRDFLAKVGYDVPKNIPVVIGHTRASTVGGKTRTNAHPFGFGTSEKFEDAHEFIGVHNGTLHNHKELANTYDISLKKVTLNSKNNQITTDKIDSEALLECIYKSKNFKVLSEYNGAAALVFYNVNEPEYMYCFHGASVKTLGYGSQTIWVERPLFAYQEHKNSLYISSIENSLKTIGGTDKTITDLKCNVIYKIKNGNLKTAEEFKISRSKQQMDKDYTASNFFHGSKKYAENYANPYNIYGKNNPANNNKVIKLPASTIELTEIEDNIYKDVFNGVKRNKVYSEKLRYYKNDKLINGLFCYVPKFGFYFLGASLKAAESHFNFLIGKKFFNGEFIFVEDDLLEEDKFSLPFPNKEKVYDNVIELMHFFYEGIRITSYSDYTSILRMVNLKRPFDTISLSLVAFHPIIDIKKSYEGSFHQGIYYKGALATDIVVPLGMDKKYTIKNGNTTKIELIKTATVGKQTNLELIKQELEIDAEDCGKDCALTDSYTEDEEFLQTLDEVFLDTFMALQEGREKLEKFKDKARGSKALEIVNKFINDAGKLVHVEETYEEN